MRSTEPLPQWFVRHCAHWNRYTYTNLLDAWRTHGITPSSLVTYRRALRNVTCIGIVGSVGKSTLVRVLAALLPGAHGTVYRTRVNDNWLPQMPLIMHQIAARKPRIAILECGVSRKGDARALAYLLPFQALIYTELVPVHLAEFGKFEWLVAEKFQFIARRNACILFSHSANRALMEERGLHPQYYGPGTDYACAESALTPSRTRVTLQTPQGRLTATVPLLGYHVGDAVSGALAVVGGFFHIPLTGRVADLLRRVRPLPLRMQRYRTAGAEFLIDTANANRRSILNAVRTFLDLPDERGKHLVLSGVSGMGAAAGGESAHLTTVLPRLPLRRLASLTLVGTELRLLVRAVRRAFPRLPLTHLSSLEQAQGMDLAKFRGGLVLLRSGTRQGKNLANLLPGFRQRSDETRGVRRP